jgi:hypothetical protein
MAIEKRNILHIPKVIYLGVKYMAKQQNITQAGFVDKICDDILNGRYDVLIKTLDRRNIRSLAIRQKKHKQVIQYLQESGVSFAQLLPYIINSDYK